MTRTILVTGGAGFIGSALVRRLLSVGHDRVVNVDSLTYAGNLGSLGPALKNDRHTFERVDIRDSGEVARVFRAYQPNAVIHLAAESHVDRSIQGSAEFVTTNVNGTFTLLEAARSHWVTLTGEAKARFRFLHVSTDEVFGSLGTHGRFTEASPYSPNSPYSATKAASDHLARAWFHTHGLPVLVTNCSNNYGPYQFPEKLIPVVILSAVAGRPIPVYGRGENVRDWLYVDDHAAALLAVLEGGRPGETYNIGGDSERTNLDVVRSICGILDELAPQSGLGQHESLITFVEDRPGHDLRYAIDSRKITTELGWSPVESFDTGLRRTVHWYLENAEWCRRVMDGTYQLERLGLVGSQS